MIVQKLVSISAALLLMTNALPVFADDVTVTPTNTVKQICHDTINNSADLIHAYVDGIKFETTEPVIEQSTCDNYTYTYVDNRVEQVNEPTHLNVDEFMALYGQESSSVETDAAYQQALANYNAALAEYEAASQLVETTKEVEVEVIEEVVDEQGNPSQVTRTEIQTITEMVLAGDVEEAKANLDAAKAQLDAASQALHIVETVNQVPSLIEEETAVQEEVTYSSSGTCGDNLTWTLDDSGTLTIFGNGKMNDYDYFTESPWGTEIIIADIKTGVTNIGDSAFRNCNMLKDVHIPSSVAFIGSFAFFGCSSLKNISIPASVTLINSGAFYECSNLTSVNIPYGVNIIDVNLFYGCTSLTSVTIPDSVSMIGQSAFHGCENLMEITIPDSVTIVRNHAFEECRGLANVTVSKNIRTIESGTFSQCNSLTNITIPDKVTAIKQDSFSECTNLKTVTIPKNVKTIEQDAFAWCDNLSDIYYLSTEEEWEEKNLYSFKDSVTIHFIDDIPFKDVSKDDWYYSVAKECYETGLINGTSETTFSPYQTMTRAMVVTILWRMEGEPNTTFNNKFKDVSSSQWYATSISWAVNNGVVNGYGDGTFKPDGAVTREQIAVMLANFAKYSGVYKPGTKKLNTYPDGLQVSTWAQQGMKWAINNGIISGNGEGYLRPKKSATRAEGAAMLLRMQNWL